MPPVLDCGTFAPHSSFSVMTDSWIKNRLRLEPMLAWSACLALYFLPRFPDLVGGKEARLGAWLWAEHLHREPETFFAWILLMATAIYRGRSTVLEAFNQTHRPNLSPYLFLGLALYVTGYRLAHLPLVAFSFAFTALGLLESYHRGARSLYTVPVLSIIMAVPGVFEGLFYPMRVLTAAVSGFVLQAVFEVRRQGALMIWRHAEYLQVQIGDECSGVSALQSLLLLGLGFGLFYHLRAASSWWWLTGMVVVAAIIVNVMRVLLIMLVSTRWGMEAGMLFHDTLAGYVAFIPVVYVMIRIMHRARREGNLP